MKRGLTKSLVFVGLLASVVWIVGCTSQEESKPIEEETMASTIFLKHKVSDYSAWRLVYDADAPRRLEAGLQEMGVYRDSDNENMVLMVWSAEDGNALKAMLESADLAEKMKEAGVTSVPETWMGESME